MYEVRKQLKMKVSDSRKIHIIALPQGTTKACLSDAKSLATPGRPGVTPAGCTTLVAISTAICVLGPWVQVSSNRPNNTSQTSSR